MNSPSLFSAALSTFTLGTAGHSLLPLAKYSCAWSDARYSRNLTAASLLGACLSMPAPDTLMWVPQLAWFGHTALIFATTA